MLCHRHDNYVVYGEPHNPVSKLISQLTLEEFQGLAPINQLDDVSLHGSSPTSSEASMATALFPNGASPASSTASSRLLRQQRNGVPAVAYEPTLRSWDVEEDDHLPTLGEVFAALPPNVPFDIEVKMSTPNDLAQTPAGEISRMLDSILAEVDAAVAAHGPRLLLFSCFDPDVCLELRRRRPEHAVFFLSGGGAYEHADPRRTSMQAAIDFAAASSLQGIIVHTGALARQPDVVAAAHRCSLSVLTYGRRNNDPEWVREQQALGVHAVIVDDVFGVVAAIRSDQTAAVLMPA